MPGERLAQRDLGRGKIADFAQHADVRVLPQETLQKHAPGHSPGLIELGLILFIITILFQIAAQAWLRRVQRATGGRA